MANLFLRNLGLVLILTVAFLVMLLIAKAAGGFLLIGGDWVIWFGLLCWRIAVSFQDAIETKGSHPYSVGRNSFRLIGLMLGVLLTQVVLSTLVVFYVESREIADRALFTLPGIAGSTSLLIPAHFYFQNKGWQNGVVPLLIFLGLAVWWEVVRNLWPDEVLLGPSIALATFALSSLLIRPALLHATLTDAKQSG